MSQYTKQQAARIIMDCAAKYESELEGRSLLFILTNKHKQVSDLEVFFNRNNFLHLTGIKLNQAITATDFYRRCIEHRLSDDDFEFSADGTTQLKLEILPHLMVKDLAAKMVGNYDGNNPKLYTEKLAGNIKGCIGFIQTQNQINVPNTVLNVNIRTITNLPLRVIATYRKQREESSYSELVYKAKKSIG